MVDACCVRCAAARTSQPRPCSRRAQGCSMVSVSSPETRGQGGRGHCPSAFRSSVRHATATCVWPSRPPAGRACLFPLTIAAIAALAGGTMSCPKLFLASLNAQRGRHAVAHVHGRDVRALREPSARTSPSRLFNNICVCAHAFRRLLIPVLA